MFKITTSQWVSTAPTVSVVIYQTETDAEVTLKWSLQYYASSAANTSVNKDYSVYIDGERVALGTYNINGKVGSHTITEGTKIIEKTAKARSIYVTCSFGFNLTWSGSYAGTKSASGYISIPALPTYTITYSANGGRGAPSSQTKTYGVALTLSSTKPTRTGYTFQNWTTKLVGGVAYAPGASYTANAGATLYAVWKANTYTVSYNANGGSGAPASQTKTYGVALTLSSTIPTRARYTFKGWGTSSSTTTVTYAAGASYTSNAAITLYAIWEYTYVKPRITNLSVARCNSSGTALDTGTSALVSFGWACDSNLSSIVIEWESETGGSGSKTTSLSGKSGTANVVVGESSLTTESTYSITVIVTDADGASYAFGTLTGTKFTIDFLSGGNGAAFGKPAELEGVLDIGFKTRLDGGLLYPVLPPETDLNKVLTPNTYTGANISSNNYVNCPVTSGTFTLLVESGGEEGQIRQTYVSCSKYKPEMYTRFYYQDTWGDWFWSSTNEYILFEDSAGTSSTVWLKESMKYYRYLEIYYTDNNGKIGGYTKVYNPQDKTLCLHIQEAGSTIHSRQTTYALSGVTIKPNTDTASYIKFSGTSFTISSGTNYIKIIRVIGRA